MPPIQPQPDMPQMVPPGQPVPGTPPMMPDQSGMQPIGSGQAPPSAVKPATAAQPSANHSTTQKSLLFSEIRDGMVIMNDGSFRSIIACESINFDLMSNREREGIEYSYQSFLNSLNFDIQILVRSQQVDIEPYLDKLESIRQSQDNMLLGVLMDDYIKFIDTLAEVANIMDKSFYIVIPYASALTGEKIVEKGKGFFSQFLPKPAVNVTKIDATTYQKAKDEMSNRIATVVDGLYQIGVRCKQLNTKQIGELYYNVYNPDTAVNQPLGDFTEHTNTYTKKGEGQFIPSNLTPGSMG